MNIPEGEDPNPFGEMLKHMILENTFEGNIGDGWEGLCRWLDVPVPDSPFPRTNNQEEFFKLAEKGL